MSFVCKERGWGGGKGRFWGEGEGTGEWEVEVFCLKLPSPPFMNSTLLLPFDLYNHGRTLKLGQIISGKAMMGMCIIFLVS